MSEQFREKCKELFREAKTIKEEVPFLLLILQGRHVEALKKLENSQPYDVIICDYDMPYLNGIDTIRLMKDKLKLSIEKQAVILLHSSIDNTELNQKCITQNKNYIVSRKKRTAG